MELNIPILQTDRLELVAPDESHLDVYAAMYGDPGLMAHIRGGQTFDRAGSWNKIALALGHFLLRGYGLWSVRERASGEIVGQAGLINPTGYLAMEIGWLIHRDYWGRGYASEAGQAALSYALEVVQAARVEAHIEPANLASLAVARKLGMAVDGLASSPTMTILEKTRSAA